MIHDPHTAPPDRWSELMRTAIDRAQPTADAAAQPVTSASDADADDAAIGDVVARAAHTMEQHAQGVRRIRSAALALRERASAGPLAPSLPSFVGSPLPTPLRAGGTVDRKG